jgi:hypothetical protein
MTKLLTTHQITVLLRARVLAIEQEQPGPLSFDQDLLVEDICQALDVKVQDVLDYVPSAAACLDLAFGTPGHSPEGLDHGELHFLRLDPVRAPLEVTP